MKYHLEKEKNCNTTRTNLNFFYSFVKKLYNPFWPQRSQHLYSSHACAHASKFDTLTSWVEAHLLTHTVHPWCLDVLTPWSRLSAELSLPPLAQHDLSLHQPVCMCWKGCIEKLTVLRSLRERCLMCKSAESCPHGKKQKIMENGFVLFRNEKYWEMYLIPGAKQQRKVVISSQLAEVLVSPVLCSVNFKCTCVYTRDHGDLNRGVGRHVVCALTLMRKQFCHWTTKTCFVKGTLFR